MRPKGHCTCLATEPCYQWRQLVGPGPFEEGEKKIGISSDVVEAMGEG